ncbi:DUF222 domain-containing protein [Tomitella gaofuii]|uniref:DUF222 domain-containing protein n=1 Tax=Tomitella gaofuii TaxID=2760083 RepID=UPI0022A80CB2|nr:DUF222 domain-containing protein [Tomitella gaofuii]
MSRDVCKADDRTLDQRRADALMALVDGAQVLACICGDESCPRAGRSAPAQRKPLVHVIMLDSTLRGDEDRVCGKNRAIATRAPTAPPRSVATLPADSDPRAPFGRTLRVRPRSSPGRPHEAGGEPSGSPSALRAERHQAVVPAGPRPARPRQKVIPPATPRTSQRGTSSPGGTHATEAGPADQTASHRHLA